MAVELHLFGRPRAVVDKESFDLAFERRHQLLAYLAVRRGWVGRAEIAALLWPGVESRLALANLRKTVFRLDALPFPAHVEAQGNALRFEPQTDVLRFDSLLREGQHAEALAFRAADFMAGFDDDGEGWSAWLAFERERLRAAWRAAAIARLESGIDPAEAVAITTRMLEADPIDEDAVRAHMRRLVDAGQVAEARRVYREFEQRLKDGFALSPGAELKALHDSLGRSAAVAPPRTARVSNDETFIGRTNELRQIGETLDNRKCRLLCIVGPGGVGKTRLARRVQQELAGRYEGGTAFAPLDAVAHAADVPGAINRALGLSTTVGDPLSAAIEHLRERELLLVLDNFEHVATATTVVQKLLDECPRVQVVVTSRVRLGSRAEWMMPLDGLPCPDPEDIDRLEAFDAARLFVRSAQRMDPSLQPAANAEAIIAICREVQGLPLALELAASWARVLSCEEIAADLRRGTQLLSAQDPAWPQRHGSMEIVFEHSWALLAGPERDALARLSVFRGGFTPDAAQRVAQAPLPILASLVDKSLLRKDGQRLTQHPLIQQLSQVRLDAGVRGDVEARHARYFHDLLRQLDITLVPGGREALARIDSEFENCCAAWQWSAAHHDAEGPAMSVGALRSYCEHRARPRDGAQVMRAALENDAGIAGIPALRIALAQLEYRMDSYAEAFAQVEAALLLLRGKRESVQRVACMQLIGSLNLRTGNYGEARRAYKEALRLTPPTHTRLQAIMLDHLALVEKRAGRFAESIAMSMRALEQFRAVGYYAGEALCLNNMAALLNDQGEHEKARMHLRTALALCEKHGLVSTRVYVLSNLVECDLHTGNLDGAQASVDAGIEQSQAGGFRWIEASLWLDRARIAVRRGDTSRARDDLQHGAELANQIAQPSLLLDTIVCFGEVLHAEGHSKEALAALGFAAEQETATALDRLYIQTLVKRWHIPFTPSTPPKLDFAEFAQRIGTEASISHAPLIASLRVH